MGSKGSIIESMKEELAGKEDHIESLEAELERGQKSYSQNRKLLRNGNDGSKDDLNQHLVEEFEYQQKDLQRQLRKEQSANKKSKRKIANLEGELEEQLADWVALGKEMEATKAQMADIEAELARRESQRQKSKAKEMKPKSRNGQQEDFDLHLDELTRKVKDARTQLESAHGRLDTAVSRHRVPSLDPK